MYEKGILDDQVFWGNFDGRSSFIGGACRFEKRTVLMRYKD